ncbi:MAG: NAD-dependent 4,6-dehydratase LegB [Clostridia bacterium]|nr:NAD-dependent 4,6-dehydratase LegB [Clostridia bacterium]
MRVLVTGAGGFIGSHLVERLTQEGYAMRAFVHYNSRGRWGWLEESPVRNEIEVIAGDVRDYDLVRRAVEGVSVVFHLAALIGIPYSYLSPVAYIRTNVEGTYNLLQAAREVGVSRFVHTSTSEVYGTARYVPIDEEHPLQAQSPYAASKIAADQLALSYFRSYGLPVTIARPFNTFGPRQSARAVIPTILAQVLSGRETIRLGNLRPTRDFNYVVDTVDGFLALAHCDRAVGEVVNIGSGRETSIGEIVDIVGRIVGREIRVAVEDDRIRPEKSEVECLVCGNAKIKGLTGWQPRHSLEEGLALTVEWMAHHLDLYKPEMYNV